MLEHNFSSYGLEISLDGSQDHMTPEAWRFEEELLHVMNFAAEGASVGQKSFPPERYSQETV